MSDFAVGTGFVRRCDLELFLSYLHHLYISGLKGSASSDKRLEVSHKVDHEYRCQYRDYHHLKITATYTMIGYLGSLKSVKIFGGLLDPWLVICH